MNKSQLVQHLRDLLENDLDDVLQGDYEEREDILSKFEDLIDRINDYQNN